MADKLKFNVVTPLALLLSGEADMVDVPGAEGDFGVLAHHSPLMSVLRFGIMRIHNDNRQSDYFVKGGFADVTPSGLTVLAEEAIALDGFTKSDLEAEIKKAEDKEGDHDALIAALQHLGETYFTSA